MVLRMIMGKMTEKGKSNAGIVSGVVSLVFGGGGLVGSAIFFIVTFLSALGLAGQEKGTPAYENQMKLVSRYQTIAIVLAVLAIALIVLGIVLLVVFIRKRRKLSKQVVS